METKRCFLALPLGPSLEGEIAELGERLRARGLRARCVRPGDVHLTLHFLGRLDGAEIASARDAAEAACSVHPPLSLRLRSLGVFPNLRAARVLWVGLAGDIQQLAELHHDLSGRLVGRGFQLEKRAFQAHLTIARFRRPPDGAEIRAIEALSAFEGQAEEVVRMAVFFESVLRPDGPLYTPLATFPLGA